MFRHLCLLCILNNMLHRWYVTIPSLKALDTFGIITLSIIVSIKNLLANEKCTAVNSIIQHCDKRLSLK